MVVKGKSCGHARKLARHLMRTDQNERIKLLELDESHGAPTIESALLEYQTLATSLTAAKHGLYETSLSPRHDETLTPEQWEQAVDILADKLGLTGQPRVVILHQKNGREHVHAVFQRTDTEKKQVISDSYNYPAHELAAREIEKTFELEPTVGVFTRERDEPRPEQDFSRAEHQKAERSGISADERKELVTNLYKEAERGRNFVDALEENGYYLARGDRANVFMVIDPQYEAHRLSTCLKKVKMSEVKAFLHPIEPSNFETVEQCKERLLSQEHVKEEAEKLAEKQLAQMARLANEYQLALDRLEARQSIDNEIVEDSRKPFEPFGFVEAIKTAFGVTWYQEKVKQREDRERLAQQSQEYNDLKREQLNERTDLQRAHRSEWFKFDQENKPELGIRSRFEVTAVHKRENEFDEKMGALRDFDAGNDEWQVINEQLFRLFRHRDKVEYQANYLEALEFSVINDFEAIFEDGAEALQAFRDMAAEASIKKAIKALERRPVQFGKLSDNGAAVIKQHIDSVAVDVSKTHYLKNRVKNAVDGLELPGGLILTLQEMKLKYMQSVPEEKLKLLRDMQLAASRLSDAQRQSLDSDEKHAISQARELFKDRKKRKLADGLLMQKQERDEQARRQSLELKREIEPPG
jgi:MobA/VirD2-like, nuclease domain